MSSSTENNININDEQERMGEILAPDLVSSHPWEEIILGTAAVAQRIISHWMSYTHHAFRAEPLKA